MASELEVTHQKVTAGLYSLSSEQLCEIADDLGVEDVTQELSRLRIVKLVHRHLNRDEVDEQPDGGLSMLKAVLEAVKKFHIHVPEAAADDPSPSNDEEPAPSTPSSQTPSSQTPAQAPAMQTASQVTLRREFKIAGQIGEPGQRDKLSFSSLIHQIQSGLDKKYPEKEIVSAVIRSIVPGAKLRSYLEGKADLTLPTLRRILRAHFREKDATELFNQLSRLAQEQKESAQAFLIRALELRQRVLFASQEAGSSFTYDASLVQGVFLHSVQTGLRDSGVKTEMRPHFNNKTISDEDLFDFLNTAATNEEESRLKLQGRKGSSLHEAHANVIQPETKAEPPKKGNPLMQEVQSTSADILVLKAQVAEIRDVLLKGQNSASQARPTNQRPRGCKTCRDNGQGETCHHCFRCGSEEHYARGCRLNRRGPRSDGPGNGQGLPPRDRV